MLWSGELPRTASGKIIRRALADETRWTKVLYAPRLSGASGGQLV